MGYNSIAYTRGIRPFPNKEYIINTSIPEPNTGCWLWTLAGKYGSISIDRKQYRAHRISYQLFNGPIPNDLFVCHKCDTPACVNPEHLFLGTAKDNFDDMIRKNRHKPIPKKLIRRSTVET